MRKPRATCEELQTYILEILVRRPMIQSALCISLGDRLRYKNPKMMVCPKQIPGAPSAIARLKECGQITVVKQGRSLLYARSGNGSVSSPQHPKSPRRRRRSNTAVAPTDEQLLRAVGDAVFQLRIRRQRKLEDIESSLTSAQELMRRIAECQDALREQLSQISIQYGELRESESARSVSLHDDRRQELARSIDAELDRPEVESKSAPESEP